MLVNRLIFIYLQNSIFTLRFDHRRLTAMAPICPTATRISLPNALRALYREFAIQLHTPSNRPLQHLALPRHAHRTFSTAPRTSFSQHELPESSQDVPSATSASLTAETAQRSTQATTTTAASVPSRRTGKEKANSREKRKASGTEKDKDRKRDEKKTLSSDPETDKKRELWRIQKEALKRKFPNGWIPMKKLSPDALEGIRHLHATAPDKFTTPVLADEFGVSPEAIRRILKSKWRPSPEELERRRKRWERRYDRIWSHMSELGLRPHGKRTESVSDATTLLYNRSKKGLKPGDMMEP
ncbi:hypothetical protein BJX61DRAFT_501097 [Aspergillus egyptiacus]|nr:hypothetical protein BJX61DRAFT_501097 [Aspergillus egyptiacus]